jgi:hypothetical protein
MPREEKGPMWEGSPCGGLNVMGCSNEVRRFLTVTTLLKMNSHGSQSNPLTSLLLQRVMLDI